MGRSVRSGAVAKYKIDKMLIGLIEVLIHVVIDVLEDIMNTVVLDSFRQEPGTNASINSDD